MTADPDQHPSETVREVCKRLRCPFCGIPRGAGLAITGIEDMAAHTYRIATRCFRCGSLAYMTIEVTGDEAKEEATLEAGPTVPVTADELLDVRAMDQGAFDDAWLKLTGKA